MDADEVPSQCHYAGGQVCPQCDSKHGVAHKYCSWCGTALRSDEQPDHPIREGAVLRRRYEGESTAVLMIVVSRLRDLDDGHIEYEIADPTLTGYHQYRAEDLEDCFEDTGLTADSSHKPVQDDEIRALYQDLHDEHGEHSFHTVHDSETHEPSGEQCLHCRKMRGENA